jgi:hypothetical protein
MSAIRTLATNSGDYSFLVGPSQSFKPRQTRRVRSPQGRSAVISMLDALGLLDGLSLHLNVDGGVAVGRSDTSVAQPLADREDVDTRLQQMYRSGACCGGADAWLQAWAAQLEHGRNVSSRYSEPRTG